ncbi:MAG: transglutaminase family protein [Burkholderiales bacterium]|nr:transglutaminase family protein [Burkholderiales bacterium]
MTPTSPKPAEKPPTPATSAGASPAPGKAAVPPTNPPVIPADDAPVTETSVLDLTRADELHELTVTAAAARLTAGQTVAQAARLVFSPVPAHQVEKVLALADGPTRRLHVRHETTYDYDAAVELAHHLAHLRPRNTAEQQVQDWALEISPAPDALRTDRGKGDIVAPQRVFEGADVHDAVETDGDPLRQGLDGWGNWRCSFSHSVVHDSLRVVSTFSAELCRPPPINAELSPPWEDVAERLRYHPGELDDAEREAVEFALTSYYAPRDAALRRYAASMFPPGRPLLLGALALMHEINEGFDFRPHATSVATRATDALRLRKGVCQDFAHVMIGALRSLGLAARYVSGYLLTRPPPGQARLVGADASHAWVAVWCPLHGWVALDPTNAVRVGLDHVTLAWGRDYADVAPLRGVIRGSGRAVPQVAVTVEPEEPEVA